MNRASSECELAQWPGHGLMPRVRRLSDKQVREIDCVIDRCLRLQHAAMTLVGDDIEDVRQQIWLVVWERVATYRPDPQKVVAYATVVARGAIVDLIRQWSRNRNRDPRVVNVVDLDVAEGQAASPASSGRSDTETWAATEDMATCLAGTSPRQQCRAGRVANESIAAAARAEGIAPSTLRDQLRRLRTRFAAAGMRDYLCDGLGD